MISFDVKSLFTNVPLDKTIKLILRKIYQERMLDTSILWRETIIRVEGVAMRSPLGPVLAKIFVTELEIVMTPL